MDAAAQDRVGEITGKTQHAWTAHFWLLLGLLGLLSGVSGCTTTGRYSLAAPPLKAVKDTIGDNSLEKVHDLVQDSQTKCGLFVDSMFANTARNNTLLDVIGTALSAAATAVTPINAVHILSAGSTLASGTKTSVSTNYLNGVAVSHITQAIQSTYSADIAKYLAYLDTIKDPASVDVYIERSRILSYHNECSLPSADGSIASALQPAAPASASTFALSVTYTLGANETVQSIAQGIANAIDADGNFKAAGITAVGTVSGSTGVVSFSVRQGQSVSWSTPVVFAPVKGAATANESADFNPGPPPLLKVSIAAGLRAQQGDSLTIRGTSQASSTSSAAPVPVATANAAPAAAAPAPVAAAPAPAAAVPVPVAAVPVPVAAAPAPAAAAPAPGAAAPAPAAAAPATTGAPASGVLPPPAAISGSAPSNKH